METLTEAGALLASRHPISPCGFYPKQEPVPYYFSNSSNLTQPPGNGTYPGFHQVPENDSWTNSQITRNHVYPSHQRKVEERQEEKSDNTGLYIPQTHLRNSPHRFSSSVHPQLPQRQMFATSSSSLPHYPDDQNPPSSRERDQIENKNMDAENNKNMDPENNDSRNKFNTLISDKLQFRLHNSSEHSSYPRHDSTPLNNDNMHLLQYGYSKNSIHGNYSTDKHRAIYYQRDFHEPPQHLRGMYSSDSTGVISYTRPRGHSVTSEDEQTVDIDECQDKVVYSEYRERIIRSTLHKTTMASRMMTKQLQIDQRRQQSPITIPDMYRKGVDHQLSKVEGKPAEFFKGRDITCPSITNSQFFFEDKRTALTDEGFPSPVRDKQGDNESFELHSSQNNTVTSSPDSPHNDNVGQRYNLASSPPAHNDNVGQRYNLPSSPPVNVGQRYNLPSSPPAQNDNVGQRYNLASSPPAQNDNVGQRYNLPSSPPSHNDNVSQRYNLPSSPPAQNQCPTPKKGAQSPTKSVIDYNLKSPTQNDSTHPGHTPGKLSSFTPTVVQRCSKGDISPSSPWAPPAPSLIQSHLKNPPKEDFSQDYSKPSQAPTGNSEMQEYEESLKSAGALIIQNMLSTNSSSLSQTPQPQPNQTLEFSSDTPPKQPPAPRHSHDEFAKMNTSDDGSLDAKREIFSDDGEDDSASEDTTPHSPTFSPFHDASISYPHHHFRHPFFPSQAHGPLSGLRFQFGALQGHHDRPLPGVGFPFRSIPGVPQDIALVGHMHPSRSPFVGSAPSGIGPVRQLTGDSDIFFCHLCSYSGKSKSEFDVHMNTHFEFNCPHCDYTSRTEGRLKRHIKDFHSESSSRRSMPGRPKVYKCKQCQFSATEKDKFWAHSRTHIKEDKLLQCPKCPFVTEYKHHLEYHLRNHFGSKPFKCPKCNYSCVNKSMLNSHMKSHTNVYQYRCSECTYATKYCHSLKLHLKKYNHKPATVLNQDGSLPQGLDAGSSGLSIATKRGPPRGPRGTRKDSNGPYMSHLFEMPQMPLGVGGMNPILNGMMPFWPMLSQAGMPGHPSPQPGMLPEMRSLARQMSIMADHRNNSEFSKMDDTMEEMSENSSDECKSSMRDKDEMCKFCNFIAESREALGLHLMQVHKEEAKEVIMSCGFSESFLAESFRNVNPDAKLEKQRMSESLKESDSDQSSSESQRRNSNTGFQYKEHSEFSLFKTDLKDESSKTPPPSWSQSVYPDNYSGGNRPQEVHFNLVDGNSKNEDNKCGSNSEIDILQQMTLKFGTGSLSEKIFSTKQDDLNRKNDSLNVPKRENVRGFHYIPLDLTKHKSHSPLITRASPKYNGDDDDEDDVEFNEEEEITRSNSANHQVRPQFTDLESPVKRPGIYLDGRTDPGTDLDDRTDQNNVLVVEMSSIAPRKRARKGKAYKLDTLCLKLQKRQVNTSHNEDNLNLESSFNDLKNVQAVEEDEQKNISKLHMDEPWKHPTVNTFHASIAEIKHDKDKAVVTEREAEKEKDDLVEFVKYNKRRNTCDDDNVEMKDDNKDMENDEPGEITKKKMCLQDEAELELHKLHRSLSIFNQGDNSGLESANGDSDKGKQLKNEVDNYNYLIDDNSSEATIEEKTNLDDEEANDSAILTTQTPQKHLEEDDMDQVELINTVLENRKKAVPPAVRRGTELAWKLLNDPINPVTTLPLPVDVLHVPQPPNTSSVPSGSTAILPEVNNSPVMRRDLKPQSSLPQYSHPHQPNLHHAAHTPLPPHLNLPPSHRPHTPQSHHHHHPQPFHTHTPQSIMSMKPVMAVPIPATPMAYIPPTNRMMSAEPAVASPCSRMKPSQKELYECTYCDLSFRDCVMYTVHMGYHSNQNPFQCNSCGAVSRDKVEFFLHIARSPHA